MIEKPTEITIAHIDVVVMPNGEIICKGNRIGWYKDFAKYLHRPEPTQTKEVK